MFLGNDDGVLILVEGVGFFYPKNSPLSSGFDIIVKSFNIKHNFKKGNFNSLTIEFGRCGTNKIKKKRGRLIKLPEFELTNEDNEENFNE